MKKISIALVLALLISILPSAVASASDIPTITYRKGDIAYAEAVDGCDAIVIDFNMTVMNVKGASLSTSDGYIIGYTGTLSGNTYTMSLNDVKLCKDYTYILNLEGIFDVNMSEHAFNPVTITVIAEEEVPEPETNVELVLLEDDFEGWGTTNAAFGVNENKDRWTEYAYLDGNSATRDSELHSEIVDIGGTHGNVLKMNHDSTMNNTGVRRLFKEQSFRKIRWELDVNPDSGLETLVGFRTQFDTPTFFTFMPNGNIHLMDIHGKATTKIGTYTIGNWYKCCVEIDLTSFMCNYKIVADDGTVVCRGYDLDLKKYQNTGAMSRLPFIQGVTVKAWRNGGTGDKSVYIDNVIAYVEKEMSIKEKTLYDGADTVRMGAWIGADAGSLPMEREGTLDLSKWHHYTLEYDKRTKTLVTDIKALDGSYSGRTSRTVSKSDMANETLAGLKLHTWGAADYYLDNLIITKRDELTPTPTPEPTPAPAVYTTIKELTFDNASDKNGFSSGSGTFTIENLTTGEHTGNVLKASTAQDSYFNWANTSQKNIVKVELDVKLENSAVFLMDGKFNTDGGVKRTYAITMGQGYNKGYDVVKMGDWIGSAGGAPQTQTGTLDLTKWHHMTFEYDKTTKILTTMFEALDGTYLAKTVRAVEDSNFTTTTNGVTYTYTMTSDDLAGIYLTTWGASEYYIDNFKVSESDGIVTPDDAESAIDSDDVLLDLDFEKSEDKQSFKSATVGTPSIVNLKSGDVIGNVLHLTRPAGDSNYTWTNTSDANVIKAEFDLKVNNGATFLLSIVYNKASGTATDYATTIAKKYNVATYADTKTIESVTDGIVRYEMTVTTPEDSSSQIKIATGSSQNAIPILTFNNSSVSSQGTAIGTYNAKETYRIIAEVDYDSGKLSVRVMQNDAVVCESLQADIASTYTDRSGLYVSTGISAIKVTRENELKLLPETKVTPVINRDKVTFYNEGSLVSEATSDTDEIRINFGTEMDIRTIKNVRIVNVTDRSEVDFSVVKKSSGIYSLDLSDPLLSDPLVPDHEYRLIIPEGVKSISGGKLSTPLEIDFSTEKNSCSASVSASYNGSESFTLSEMAKGNILYATTTYTNDCYAEKQATLMFCYYAGNELKSLSQFKLTLDANTVNETIVTAHSVKELDGIDKLGVMLWGEEGVTPLSQSFINIE